MYGNSIERYVSCTLDQDQAQDPVVVEVPVAATHDASYPKCRILVGVITILAITTLCLAATGQFASFPQNFMLWTRQAVLIKACITIAVIAVLASIIIKKVTKDTAWEYWAGRLPHFPTAPGKFSGNDHWQKVTIMLAKRRHWYCVVDKSLLTESNKIAFVYLNHGCLRHYFVSTIEMCSTPVHMVAAMVYNLIRLVFVPIVSLMCMAYQKASGNKIDLPLDGRIQFNEIPREIIRSIASKASKNIFQDMTQSIKQMILAPAYATAMMVALLYSMFRDPKGGRKLTSYIARAWNGGVTVDEKFEPLLFWGVGRGPNFYTAPCRQPYGVMKFDADKKPIEFYRFDSTGSMGPINRFAFYFGSPPGNNAEEHEYTRKGNSEKIIVVNRISWGKFATSPV